MPSKNITKNVIPAGMNSYDDSTRLGDGILQLVQNMRPDKQSLYTREGCAKYNVTAEVIPGSSGIFGNFNYHKIDGTAVELAVSAGTLYTGSAGVFTSSGYTTLNATNLCSIVQSGKYALVVDQASGILAYTYGVTPYLVGLPSPKIYKLIGGFESTENWVMVNGTKTSDLGYFIQGSQSYYFLSGTATTMTATYTPSAALNLTVFSDGSTSGTGDTISFWFLRYVKANFTACSIILQTSSGNYYSYSLFGDSAWTGSSLDYIAFEFKIPKSSFSSTGAPSWSSITSIQISATSDTGDTVAFNVDYLRLEKAGPIAADAAVTGVLDGTYLYKLTFVNKDGEESDGSLISNSVTVSLSQMSLSNLPISGSSRVVKRNLYRYGGTVSSWKLVTVLLNDLETTYTDNTADTSLSVEWTEIDGQPFIPKCITVAEDSIVIGNLTGPDGVHYGSGIMISQSDSIEVYDIDDFFEIEKDTGFDIYWLHFFSTRVYAGKGNSIWSFDPKNLDLPPIRESRLYGGAGPLAVCEGENGFYFLDKNKSGVIFFNGQSFINIADAQNAPSKVRNYIAAIPDAYVDRCWMLFMSNTLFVGIPETGQTYPTIILAYHVPTGFWYTISGAEWKARCGYVDRTTMHLGHATTGYVYNCFTGDLDETSAITSILWTKDDDFGQPEILKEYEKVFIFAGGLAATSVILQVAIYQNLASVATIYDSVSGSSFGHGSFGHGTFGHMVAAATLGVHKKIELPAPQIGTKGTYLGLKVTSSNRWIFRGLTQVVRLEEPMF